jgi:hypothetical protein
MNPRDPRATCLAALLFLAACDDSPTADRDSIKRALQAHYDAHPVCVAIPLSLPVDLRPDGDATRKRQLEPLVAAGLLSVSPVPKNAPDASVQAQAVDHLRYAPTAAGEAVVRQGADGFLGGTDICFARRNVTAIQSVTESADAAGVKVTRVTYDYDLKEIEPWATGAAITAAFPRIGAVLASPADRATDVLVLTDTGWTHERDLR